MRPRIALPAALAAFAAAGCGGGDRQLSLACTDSAAAIERALHDAPRAAALADGTPLSKCVADARDIGELQSFGILITRVADRLADRARTDDAAAVRLGFLIGAARRGARHSEGVPNELVHRLEVTARRIPDRAQPALERGLRAGEQRG